MTVTNVFWPVIALFLVAALGYAIGRYPRTVVRHATLPVAALALAANLVTPEPAREALGAIGFAFAACFAQVFGTTRAMRDAGYASRRWPRSHETLESVALDTFFKKIRALPKEREHAAFGQYGDDGKRVAHGVLSIDQARVLWDVAYNGAPVKNLDQLLRGGKLEITEGQVREIVEVLGDDAQILLSTLMQRAKWPTTIPRRD